MYRVYKQEFVMTKKVKWVSYVARNALKVRGRVCKYKSVPLSLEHKEWKNILERCVISNGNPIVCICIFFYSKCNRITNTLYVIVPWILLSRSASLFYGNDNVMS